MGIGNTIAFVSVGLGVIFAYPALLILLNVLYSKTTTQVADRLEHGMKGSFFVGLVVIILVGGVIFVLVSAGSVLQLIGGILYLLISFWGAIGNASLSRVFGMRLADLGDKQPSTLYQLLSGGFVLTLSFAFPLIGWFVVMPIMSCIGIGAMTLNLFKRKPRKADPIETVVEVIPQ